MSLRRSAAGLAAAGAVEYVLQLAIPVVLVRCLDPATFGQYRLLMLMASTALALAPLFMPQSLFYFLPRQPQRRGAVIANVLAYLVVAGSVVALVTSSFNPWLPQAPAVLAHANGGAASLFLGLWVVASLLDVLPTACGQALWQARATMTLAVARSAALVGVALLHPTLGALTVALITVTLLKLAGIGLFVRQVRLSDPLRMDRTLFQGQLAYAIPFALGNALFLMRLQTDQWVVALLTRPAAFAAFSVASVLLPVATLIRQPVYNAMMPRVNAAHARGDLRDIVSLVVRSNGVASLLLLPVAGALVAAAPQLVELVYTKRYLAAVMPMQIYLVGMMLNAFAVGHLLPALNLGRFATLNNGVCLVLSAAISYLGLRQFGLPGAALGSVCMLAASELWSGTRVARSLGTSLGELIPWRALGAASIGVLAGWGTVWLATPYLGGILMVVACGKGVAYLLGYAAGFAGAGGIGQARALFGRPAVA